MAEPCDLRDRVPPPPRGWERWKWYGPGLLWMISSVGSGSVLFTPRVGSRYGYSLLWAAVIIIFLMWVMIREIGRYTVVTGKTFLDGCREVPGRGYWAIWYSYWVAARGYGGGGEGGEGGEVLADSDPEERVDRLRRWKRIMGTTAAIGVVAGGLVVASFLVLGAELLGPEGIVPEGVRVAEDLTRLLADVWGRAGFWIVVLGMVIALWGTVIADQDGWGRTFADATLLLLGERRPQAQAGPLRRALAWVLGTRRRLANAYMLV